MQRKAKTRNFIVSLCLCGCILLLAGCQEKAKSPKTPKSSKPLVGTKQEKSEVSIKRENEKLKAENQQLEEQIKTLMGIGKTERIAAISTISSIEMTSRSGIQLKKSQDSNSTEKEKALVVYIRPIDDMGDCIKAAGAMKIDLWNLNTKPDKALLKSWTIEPAELRKKWSGSLLTSHYKLQFDVNSILTGKEKELTLKAEYTDYLTGKTLKAQRVINNPKDN